MGKNYISVEQYADLCGITTQAIYKRISIGKLKSIHMSGVGQLIDSNKYPPTERQKAGRRKYKQ